MIVALAEMILAEGPQIGAAATQTLRIDTLMLTMNPGGKERAEMEFHALAIDAGFKRLVKVCLAFNIWIMEFLK